jgi:hypothetical protein
LFGVVVGRLNKHTTTPKRKEKKIKEQFVQLQKSTKYTSKRMLGECKKKKKGTRLLGENGYL